VTHDERIEERFSDLEMAVILLLTVGGIHQGTIAATPEEESAAEVALANLMEKFQKRVK